MKEWLVTFTTPTSGGKFLRETVEGSDWFEAKLKLESKYSGIQIKNYTTTK